MKNKFFFSLCLMLLAAVVSLAQTTVTGTVRHSDKPLPGAKVTLEGTKISSQTDQAGKFSIKVPDPKTAVLAVNYLGMQEAIVVLSGRTSGIEVKLIEKLNQMEEVVIIGYGSQKKGNVTGTMASVSGEVLAKTPTASVAEAMVGKLPGVQITAADGSPDAAISIRVRGGGSCDFTRRF